MTITLSKQGRLTLPKSLRQSLRCAPGDRFEVAVEDDDVITLRRVSAPANRGLVDLLLACPAAFEIPARERDDSPPTNLE